MGGGGSSWGAGLWHLCPACHCPHCWWTMTSGPCCLKLEVTVAIICGISAFYCPLTPLALNFGEMTALSVEDSIRRLPSAGEAECPDLPTPRPKTAGRVRTWTNSVALNRERFCCRGTLGNGREAVSVVAGGGVSLASPGGGRSAAIQCPGRSPATGVFVPNVSNAAAAKSGPSGRAFLGPGALSDSGKERATVGSHSFQLPQQRWPRCLAP